MAIAFERENRPFRIYPNDWDRPLGSEPQIKELGYDYDAAEFIIWSHALTLEEVGQVWRDIQAACLNQDVDFLEQFPFVGRVYVGRTRNGRPTIPAPIKRQVLSTGKCLFCESTSNLTIDHIKPYSKGGTHGIENLQCLCFSCNLKKSNHWEGE